MNGGPWLGNGCRTTGLRVQLGTWFRRGGQVDPVPWPDPSTHLEAVPLPRQIQENLEFSREKQAQYLVKIVGNIFPKFS